MVDRIDVEKAVAFRVPLVELFAAALRQNAVAAVAVAGLNFRIAVSRFVKAVVAAKAPGPFLVARLFRGRFVPVPSLIQAREGDKARKFSFNCPR